MSTSLSKLLSRYFWNRPSMNRPLVSSRKSKLTARQPKRLFLTLDALEQRAVPAILVADALGGTTNTEIRGTVYDDANRDGIRNNGENGVQGWTVYLDLDNSGTLNTDAAGVMEPSVVTDINGDFRINHLRPNTYRIAEIVQAEWTPSAPAFQDITVTNNHTSTANFFNYSSGAIQGTVWNDLDANGVRATDPVTGAFTEPGLENWTVFLDLNGNRTHDASEPSTLTDAAGRYSFTNLPSGDYDVYEVLPSGWDVSPLFDTHQTVSVVARATSTQDYANFSLVNGSISGTVWNDLNADGVRAIDPVSGTFTDPGLSDWTVFLDTNNNGVLDLTEASTHTNADGQYSFNSLPAGDYEVTEALPASWNVSPLFDSHQTVTVFTGANTVAGDFANFSVLNGSISGTVWNDLNRDGIRETSISGTFTDPGLANWTVYIDLNRNRIKDATEPTTLTDANGAYSFVGLQVGDYDVREVVPTGWEVAPTFNDGNTVTVFSGTNSIAPDFANFNIATTIPGSIAGTVWNDLNGNGIRDVDPTTGAFTDPGLPGRTVFLDANANGILDPTEVSAVSGADGSYILSGVLPGSWNIVEQAAAGFTITAPFGGVQTIALHNGENATGLDFGNQAPMTATIRGVVFADSNHNGARDAGERGLEGITVYLDLNNNSALDAGEPQMATSANLFYTPTIDEAGNYSFTHLAAGIYTVRMIVPALLSSTPAAELVHVVTVAAGEDHAGVNCAAVFRPNEIHGISFNDANGNNHQDPGETGVGGRTIFVDLNRNNTLDAGEPTTVTLADGSYSFTDMTPGAYVVREVVDSGLEETYPTTIGGILWPAGVSNPAVGNVTPTSITMSLANGESQHQTVSITLPNSGALTNLVDVFLLFDDTGSFVNNSPIVRAAFPTIISQLTAALPGIDLGFGVGRFEEYGNFASEYSTGRPFILNQPVVAASTPGYLTSIQAALNRTTPGYGGDQPETDIEALYQLVTGAGFDGNNNGSVLDSGPAGLANTQLNPGNSGDVPSFASFTADPANSVMATAGQVGGGGFRPGALPIILTATDTGFAYQPKGETSVTGVGGLSLPLSALTQTSRPSTPFNSGAGLQQTVTALNSLGALVIGLGTNSQTNLDPRQGLESLSKLTGAVNRSTTSIPNGTPSPIAPGDPLYFQIASGFGASVASGVVSAIQNAVTNVAVDIDVQASDPRVHIINHTGVKAGIGSGQTATFDIEFIGDGIPARFDLQFVRSGTNVVLGSIPVVIGTPIPGNNYEFEDLPEGEIHTSVDFGARAATAPVAPTISVSGGTWTYDGGTHAAAATATNSSGNAVSGTFTFTYNGSSTLPTAAGTYAVIVSFTSSDLGYASGTATGTLVIDKATPAFSNITAPAINAGTATTIISGQLAAGAVVPVGDTVSITLGAVTQSGSVDSSGNFSISFDTSGLTAGTYTITVSFAGDANFNATSSSSATQLVNAVTTTVLTATPSATTGGTLITFTATISPNPGNLGTTTFLENGIALPGGANIPVAGGLASYQTSVLSVGAHTISATYSGAVGFTSSVSNSFNVAVSSATTTTTLSSGSPSPATTAESIDFTVTVAGGTSNDDGEVVTLVDASNGNAAVTTTGGNLSGGSAVITVPAGTLSAGTHQLVAVYAGNSLNAGSNSAPVSQTVSTAATAPTLLSVTPNGNIPSLAGIQRAAVVSLVVVFDQAVQLDSSAMSIALHTNNVFYGGVAGPFGSLPTNLVLSSTDNITWIVTFSGNTDPIADGLNSIKDGVYDFSVDASMVHPLGVPTVNGAATPPTVFYRLFGDTDLPTATANGTSVDYTATINTADNLVFRSTFNNPASYNAAFDFNGDHQINTADNLQFRNRFNRPLSWSA